MRGMYTLSVVIHFLFCYADNGMEDSTVACYTKLYAERLDGVHCVEALERHEVPVLFVKKFRLGTQNAQVHENFVVEVQRVKCLDEVNLINRVQNKFLTCREKHR